MSKKPKGRGGAGRGQGRKPKDPAKKKITGSICLTDSAWYKIECRATATGRSRSDVIQRWAERLPIL